MTVGMRRASARALAAGLVTALALAATAIAGEKPQLRGTVNVNTATQEQLEMLPGIGESRAQAVMEVRKARGGFKRVDDLLEVRGIGESSLEKLRPFVTLQGKTTAKLE